MGEGGLNGMWIFYYNHIDNASGCSADEVIRVGTPFNENGSEGVKFHRKRLLIPNSMLRERILD